MTIFSFSALEFVVKYLGLSLILMTIYLIFQMERQRSNNFAKMQNVLIFSSWLFARMRLETDDFFTW